ncbi:MAG: LysR family transcriptional regulator [Aeromicrobium erythreum]
MDLRRLALLLDLSRLGSMRAVAEERRTTTSSVSQQLAVLAREAGTPLVEPDGRRVRLTPAGRRLADHAVSILAAVDAARLDLDPQAEPRGVVRVGGFATALRTSLLPVAAELRTVHPGVEVVMAEHEPREAFTLLERDDLDLVLSYDYDLAPALPGPLLDATPLWSVGWGLGVPRRDVRRRDGFADLRAYADHPWIVNSRNDADELALRTLAGMAGFTPRIAHQIDSLDLVEDLVVAGHGVGLLPLERAVGPEVEVLPLAGGPVVLTAYAVVRHGRSQWPPLRAVLDRVVERAGR